MIPALLHTVWSSRPGLLRHAIMAKDRRAKESDCVYLKPFEYLSLSSVALITVSFYISHGRFYIYGLMSLAITASFCILGRTLAGNADYFLTLAGLLLYFFGLLIVRIMLTRSVSLQLLARIAAYDRRNLTLNPEIKGRFQDLLIFGLATVDQDQVYHLTPFGSMVGILIGLLYAVLRIHR